MTQRQLVDLILAHPCGVLSLNGYDHGAQQLTAIPGYEGHDDPVLQASVVDLTTRVKAVVTVADLQAQTAAAQASGQVIGLRARVAMRDGSPPETPVAVAVEGLGEERLNGYLHGAAITFLSGEAAGRRLWATDFDGDVVFTRQSVLGVKAGDEVRVDNRVELAFCYYNRHHVSAGDPTFSSWVVDGRPVEPQHEVAPYEAPMPSASFTATYRRIENLARARVVVSAG
jgi:hypothetical protein